jgi:predicted transcriptional regulator
MVALVPAVPIKKSITPNHIFSLEDGKPYRTLRRHLNRLGLTPDAYRAKWSLPKNYPMTAPNYSQARSELAKKIGLGNRAIRDAVVEPKRGRGRPKKVA